MNLLVIALLVAFIWLVRKFAWNGEEGTREQRKRNPELNTKNYEIHERRLENFSKSAKVDTLRHNFCKEHAPPLHFRPSEIKRGLCHKEHAHLISASIRQKNAQTRVTCVGYGNGFVSANGP